MANPRNQTSNFYILSICQLIRFLTHALHIYASDSKAKVEKLFNILVEILNLNFMQYFGICMQRSQSFNVKKMIINSIMNLKKKICGKIISNQLVSTLLSR